MKCPHCGQEHPDNIKFCPMTGKKLEAAFWLCTNPNCDFYEPLPMTAKFCPNCGAIRPSVKFEGLTGIIKCPQDMTGYFKNNHSITIEAVSHLDTSGVRSMREMFSGCSLLLELDMRSFDTSNVVDMCKMFEGCSSLRMIDLGNFDLSKVTNMKGMFEGCASLKEINFGQLNFLQKCIDTGKMFSGCNNLESIVTYNCPEEIMQMFLDVLAEAGLEDTEVHSFDD